MNLTDLSPFAEACGLKTLVDLRVVRADGVLLAEGELDLPCALVGRDNACEVTLVDAEVSPRHACIQAVGGRVLLADIGSRAGLSAGDERESIPYGWLTPTAPISIGTFRLWLRRPLCTRPTVPEASPFLPNPEALADCPRVGIRFLNGRSANAEWVVNRLMTFVGRARDCKISLAADDIAPYHCYFLHTPQGLWVVDLLTAVGVAVNGEPIRFALLKNGDRLQIGRFRLGVQYLDQPASEEVPALSVPRPAPARPQPQPDAPRRLTPAPLPPLTAPDLPAPDPVAVRQPAADPVLSPLVAQFAQAQNQMLEQFQQSMVRVFQAFGDMHREQMAGLQEELTRMTELTAELQRLQAGIVPPGVPAPPTHILPDPAEVPGATEETAVQHNWVYERMTALQAERHSLWAKLCGLMAGKPPGVGA